MSLIFDRRINRTTPGSWRTEVITQAIYLTWSRGMRPRDDVRARQMLRFLSSPLWRAYTSTYVEDYRLLRGWLDARPAGTIRRSGSRVCSTSR